MPLCLVLVSPSSQCSSFFSRGVLGLSFLMVSVLTSSCYHNNYYHYLMTALHLSVLSMIALSPISRSDDFSLKNAPTHHGTRLVIIIIIIVIIIIISSPVVTLHLSVILQTLHHHDLFQTPSKSKSP